MIDLIRKYSKIIPLAAIALCAVLLIVSLILLPKTVSNAQPTDDSEVTDESGNEVTTAGDRPTAVYTTETVTLGQSKDMGTGYIDQIVFLGDSTTYHLMAREVLAGGRNTKQVWTGSSGWLNLDSTITNTTILYPDTGEEIKISEAATLKKPKYLIITLGADYGVAYLNDQDFAKYYTRLVEEIKAASPDTKIMLQSIFPVTSDYQNNHEKLTNSNIDKKNQVIKQIAVDCNVRYLNTAETLKGSSNCLKPEYDNGDGIHLTKSAYEDILRYIRVHAYTD